MLKRILSLSMAALMLIGSFCSCELLNANNVSDIIAAADDDLDVTSYTVNIDMTFTSDDADMKAALEALDSSKITLAKAEDNFEIKTETSFGERYSEKTYTVVGDMLYSASESNLDGSVKSAKNVSLLAAADKAKVVADAGAAEILTCDDFDAVKLESSNTVQLITCTDLKSESADSLAMIFKSAFGSDSATVSVSDVELVIRIVDGKYNGTYLSCVYSVTVDGVTYDVRMQAVREYDHTTPVSIEAPYDADQYVRIPYYEVLN